MNRIDILHMLAESYIELHGSVPLDILAELEELGQDVSAYV